MVVGADKSEICRAGQAGNSWAGADATATATFLLPQGNLSY